MNGWKYLLALPLLAALSFCGGSVWAAVFTVDIMVDDPDAADINPGDGACADNFGACPLRAAIMEANARAGDDEIRFSAGGVTVLDPAMGGLPVISDFVVIDGTSVPLFHGRGTSSPLVEIDGSALGGSVVDGLRFGTGGAFSQVFGLAITGFPDNGIQVDSGADSIYIDGCYLGLDRVGNPAGNGGAGLFAVGADFLVVGKLVNIFTGAITGDGNVISANDEVGILLAGADSAVVLGNRVEQRHHCQHHRA